jgi:hypothetical protein
MRAGYVRKRSMGVTLIHERRERVASILDEEGGQLLGSARVATTPRRTVVRAA